MSKIVFYEENAAESVKYFMKKVHDPEVPGIPDKASFLDETDIAKKAKITPDDDPKRIATALGTIAGLVPNLIILYPCHDGLEEVVEEYIIKRECSVDMAILRVKSDDNYVIKDLEYIEIDPSNTELTESTFVPETKKILYLMTTERALDLVNVASDTTRVVVTSAHELMSYFKYDRFTRVSISVPQLTAGSWVELFDTLEQVIEKDPIDAVYIECADQQRDYFIKSILDILDSTFAEGDIVYFQSERSYLKVVELDKTEGELKES